MIAMKKLRAGEYKRQCKIAQKVLQYIKTYDCFYVFSRSRILDLISFCVEFNLYEIVNSTDNLRAFNIYDVKAYYDFDREQAIAYLKDNDDAV